MTSAMGTTYSEWPRNSSEALPVECHGRQAATEMGATQQQIVFSCYTEHMGVLDKCAVSLSRLESG